MVLADGQPLAMNRIWSVFRTMPYFVETVQPSTRGRVTLDPSRDIVGSVHSERAPPCPPSRKRCRSVPPFQRTQFQIFVVDCFGGPFPSCRIFRASLTLRSFLAPPLMFWKQALELTGHPPCRRCHDPSAPERTAADLDSPPIVHLIADFHPKFVDVGVGIAQGGAVAFGLPAVSLRTSRSASNPLFGGIGSLVQTLSISCSRTIFHGRVGQVGKSTVNVTTDIADFGPEIWSPLS